jgi:hypothetical protein
MAISPSSPLTGSAITGLTTPTYTLTSDTPPDVNAKAWVVTALGGTQTGVSVHKNEMPFRVIVRRPKVVKTPSARNTVTGQYVNAGKNEYSITIVKGVNILNGMSNTQYENIVAKLTLAVPIAMGNDEVQLSALASFLGGFITNQIQGIKDTSLNSVL